jgi:hypothetical protein
MTPRTATCTCGQLRIACEGAPVRVTMCHCYACQRRTGSLFGVQARFADAATKVEGRHSQYVRRAEDGDDVIYRFCPVCGSTVFWSLASEPGLTAIGVGSFADPSFPAPKVSSWEKWRHPWLPLPADMEHHE